MGINQSKIKKKWKHGNTKPSMDCEFSSPERQMYITQCVPLHKAALLGDWETAKVILEENSTLIRTPITDGGETALHVAVVGRHNYFVSNLLVLMNENDLEIRDAEGRTAFYFAAGAGPIGTVKCMMMKNENLATIRGENGTTPLFMAAREGHEEIAEYLYPFYDLEGWTRDDQVALLTTCVDSKLYGLAMDIVNKYKILATTADVNGETPLQVLARKPLIFSRSRDNIVNNVLSHMKLKTHDANATCDAYTLLGYLLDNTICLDDMEMRQNNISKVAFVAAEYGNHDFLVELIHRYPDILYAVNELGRSIFHVAVLNRHVKVFNLIHDFRGVGDLIATRIDNNGNNMLHLAGMQAPANQLASIPGAVLQMQRELLWYKEVEKLVRAFYINKKNSAGKTPYEVFLGGHEHLMKEAEKLLKQTAKSCNLVAMFIATVAFTTAFAVPGGYNNTTGAPILENKRLFIIFAVSEAVATVSSLTSMLMFLSILTSPYSDDDYLKTLPFWLVTGVTSLFISIVAMMVLLCTSLLFFQHGWAMSTALVLVFFVCVLVMFVVLKYPFLVTMQSCTYNYRGLFQSDNRFHV